MQGVWLLREGCAEIRWRFRALSTCTVTVLLSPHCFIVTSQHSFTPEVTLQPGALDTRQRLNSCAPQ